MEARNSPFPPGAGYRFFLVYCALFVPYSIVTPYFQQLLSYLGYGPAEIGYIQGGLELMAVVAPFCWGLLADRHGGARPLLFLTVSLSIPVFWCFLCTSGVGSAVVVALLFGLFMKASIPLTDGMTLSYIKRHGGDYGHVRIGGTTGYLLFLGLFDVVFWLSGGGSVHGILWAFTVAAVLQLLSLLLVPADMSPDAGPASASSGGLLFRSYFRRAFLLVTLVAFLGRFAMMSYYSFFSRFLSEQYGLEQVGWVWALGSACEIPLVFYSHRVMSRVGVKFLLSLSMLGIVLRLAGFGLDFGFGFMLLLQPLHMLTFGAYHCSTLEYVSRLFPAEHQASAQGIFSAVTIGLGGLLGSALGGVLIEHFGYECLYLSYAGVALAGLAICLVAVPEVSEKANSEGV